MLVTDGEFGCGEGCEDVVGVRRQVKGLGSAFQWTNRLIHTTAIEPGWHLTKDARV